MRSRVAVTMLLNIFFSASALAAPETVRFSLLPLMEQMGYSAASWPRVPIQSELDVLAAINGTPQKIEMVKSHEWPFEAFAANSTLSLTAVALDPRRYPKGLGLQSRIIVLDVPRYEGDLRVNSTFDLPDKGSVGDLWFETESLLIAESISTPADDQLQFGYARNYFFFNADSGTSFGLTDVLPFKNVISTRKFGDDLYVVAHKVSRKDIVFTIISFDGQTRRFNTLTTIADFEVGTSLLHNPVNKPGRDVWILGPNHTEVFFSTYNDEKEGWEKWALIRQEDSVFVGPLRESRRQEADIKGLIENSDNFLLVATNDGGKAIQSTAIDEQLISVRGTKSRYLRLRKVQAGFTGEEAAHPLYNHYLIGVDGRAEVLINERLVYSDSKDGGLMGLSNQNKVTGDVFLIRSVYDEEGLMADSIKNASDLCQSWLTSLRKK